MPSTKYPALFILLVFHVGNFRSGGAPHATRLSCLSINRRIFFSSFSRISSFFSEFPVQFYFDLWQNMLGKVTFGKTLRNVTIDFREISRRKFNFREISQRKFSGKFSGNFSVKFFGKFSGNFSAKIFGKESVTKMKFNFVARFFVYRSEMMSETRKKLKIPLILG